MFSDSIITIFFFIFINLYLGLVEVGERTYINGPLHQHHFMTWISRYKQQQQQHQQKKKHFQNFSWFQLYFHKVCNYAWFYYLCSIDYCVELSVIDDNLCKNYSLFTLKWLIYDSNLKWFQFNPLEEMCFVEETNRCKEFKFWKKLRAPSLWNHCVSL